MWNHTGLACLPKLFKAKILKILSQLFPLPQLLELQLPLLLNLPLLKLKRNQVRFFHGFDSFLVEKEEKKEEEADVDMGGLFGDDY